MKTEASNRPENARDGLVENTSAPSAESFLPPLPSTTTSRTSLTLYWSLLRLPPINLWTMPRASPTKENTNEENIADSELRNQHTR